MLARTKLSISLLVSVVIFVLHLFLVYSIATRNKEVLWLIILAISPSIWGPAFIISFVNLLFAWRLEDISVKERRAVRTVAAFVFIVTLIKLFLVMFIYLVVTSKRIA